MNKIITILLALAVIGLGIRVYVYQQPSSAPLLVTSSGVWYRSGNQLMTNPSNLGLSFGGLDVRSVQQSFTAATTTPCSIANPFSATTTLLAYTAQITVGTSTAATYDVATSTTPYATSSPAIVLAHSVAAGSQDTMFWLPNSATTTKRVIPGINSVTGESYMTIGPSQYVNLKTAGAGLGGYTYTGTCTGLFAKP